MSIHFDRTKEEVESKKEIDENNVEVENVGKDKERQDASRAGTQRKSKKKERADREIESMRRRSPEFSSRRLPIPSYPSPKKRVFKRQSADVTLV